MDPKLWSDREVQHLSAKGRRAWKAKLSGAEVHTSASGPGTKPREATKAYPTKEKAAAELLKALRKKMLEDFVYLRPYKEAAAGELLFAMALPGGGPADNFDLSADGQVLFVGAGRGDPSARVLWASLTTGEVRRFSVAPDPGRSQLFIHGAQLDANGLGYFGLNEKVRSVDLQTGAWSNIASINGKSAAYVNPFCVELQRDAQHERFLLVDNMNLEARERSSGTTLCKIPLGAKTSECRKIALSPSGRFAVLYVVSRELIYHHDDAKEDKTNELQVWRLQDSTLIAKLPLGEERDEPHQLGMSFDDQEVLCHSEKNQLTRFTIATQARARISLPQQWYTLWDWSPAGELAIVTGEQLLLMTPDFQIKQRFTIEPQRAQRLRYSGGVAVVGGGGLFCAYRTK